MRKRKVLPWKKVGAPITLASSFCRKLLSQLYRNPHASGVEEFSLIIQTDGVVVLPLTEDHQVIACRQYRPGCHRILLGLPGGGFEDGVNETPTDVARRELLEETGYEADELTCLGYGWLSPTGSPTKTYCVLARHCRKRQAPKDDVQEVIEVVSMSLEEWVSQILSGEVSDPFAVLATVRALPHLGVRISKMSQSESREDSVRKGEGA